MRWRKNNSVGYHLRIILLLILPSVCFFPPRSTAMLVDPERIAARLRIEQEIEMDKLIKLGRSRRQLATPKEISISITAPLFSSRLFEYGLDVGDEELSRSQDVAKKITLTYPLRFYGVDTSTVYILSNGGIGFGENSRTYRPNVLPSDLKLIAIFWNRNDLRNGGHVYFREITNGRVLERGQSEIRYQYDELVKVKTCLLITWDQMQPFGAASLPEDNTNTFQAALFITDNGTFANFIYKNIGWTQGGEAGFNKGDMKHFFALPTSGTGNIMYLEEYGNTGIPGEWMFKLGPQRVERCKAGIKGDTCDEECLAGEWGPDCALCCHCASGTCSSTNGDCVGGKCANCWAEPPACQQRKEKCHEMVEEQCAHNAISFTDYDRCGDPIQRCQCLSGFKGDGRSKCDDINECTEAGVCHENAVCMNTPGHYFCSCLDGFSGDGVKECKSSSILYPYRGHHELSKDKNGKMLLHLKKPLQILGKKLNQLTISSKGIISLEDSSKIKPGDNLASSGLHGIAPFFANIDIGKGGQIFADETTDPKILSRATETVAKRTGDKTFKATSAVLATYVNVTDANRKVPGSTFQALLIGGTSKQHQDETYAHILYKDLPWTDGAEAAILTYGSKIPLMLPGSGTDAVMDLSKASNIGVPGQWLYRIDSDNVPMCLQSNMQPPYCEPAEVGHSVASTLPELNVETTTNPKHNSSVSKDDDLEGEVVEIPEPQIIHPVLIESPPISRVHSLEGGKSVASIIKDVGSGGTSKQKQITPHVPLISLGRHDIEDLPPDAFDVPIPSFVTTESQMSTILQTEDSELSHKNRLTADDDNDDITSARPLESVTWNGNIFAVDGATKEPPGTTGKPLMEFVNPIEKVKAVEMDFSDDEQKSITTEQNENIPIDISRPESSNQQHHTENQLSQTAMVTHQSVQTTIVENRNDNEFIGIEISTTNKPLFIFSTLPKKRPMPTKPKLITAHGALTTPHGPYDLQNDVKIEASTSNLAVIIPTAIIAVWLLLLAVIALFCCCRKKRAERHFRDMYFPHHHQIKPVATTYVMRKDSKHFDGSYEDHLEKAARLSSELNSYNQSGRISLYGSYWNLASGTTTTSANAIPTSSRQSPFSQYSGQQQRYTYGSRY